MISLADCRVLRTRSYRLVSELVACWHSVLPHSPAGFRVAFLVEDAGRHPIAVAMWGRPVARMEDQVATLELTRQAHGPWAPRNLGSWFLARQRAWIREHMPGIARLISYQDADAHDGALYKADNWRMVRETFSARSWSESRPGRRVGSERQHKIKWERCP